MFPDKMLEVLKREGVVAIVTQGEDGPHLVNTWNTYLLVAPGGRLLFPAGDLDTTEANLQKNNQVLLTLGSHEISGFSGPGVGFLIRGTATFLKEGSDFDCIKKRFPWARAAVEVKIDSITQTL